MLPFFIGGITKILSDGESEHILLIIWNKYFYWCELIRILINKFDEKIV